MRKYMALFLENRVVVWILVVLGYASAIYMITSDTPTIPVESSFTYYLSMAQGESVPAPFNTRILIPWIVSLFGGTAEVFHRVNLVLLLLTIIIFAATYRDFVAPILFIVLARAVSVYAGEPGIDAAIYLMLVVSLFIAERELDHVMPVLSLVAVLIHPVAYMLVFSVSLAYKRPKLIVGALISLPLFLVFSPFSSYLVVYEMTFSRVLWTFMSLNMLWVGVLTIDLDRDSLVLFFVSGVCGLSFLLASNASRMLAPLGIILSKRVSDILRRWNEIENICNG